MIEIINRYLFLIAGKIASLAEKASSQRQKMPNKNPSLIFINEGFYIIKARLSFKAIIDQSNPLPFGRKHLMRPFRQHLRLPSGVLLRHRKYW